MFHIGNSIFSTMILIANNCFSNYIKLIHTVWCISIISIYSYYFYIDLENSVTLRFFQGFLITCFLKKIIDMPDFRFNLAVLLYICIFFNF